MYCIFDITVYDHLNNSAQWGKDISLGFRTFYRSDEWPDPSRRFPVPAPLRRPAIFITDKYYLRLVQEFEAHQEFKEKENQKQRVRFIF